MPFLFIFAILFALVPIFWNFIVENYVAIGTVATAFAFLATAWAAFEARYSAKAAMKAVKLTSDSLYEMRKASFKQWFQLLLEQHAPMHDEVQNLISTDQDISIKFNINFLQSSFPTLSKKTEVIRYINHIVSILEFVDNDFYTTNASFNEKKQYVEQLTNRINSDVKLVIAILGLNVFDNGTYTPRRLNELLNKYDFFNRECFFKEAIEKINTLDDYVNELFYKNYRNYIEIYLRKNVLTHQVEIINPIANSNFKPKVKTSIAVIWAYNNLCHAYLKKSFDELPGFMKATIDIWLENSLTIKDEHNDIFRNYVGFDLNIQGHDTIKIKAIRQLKFLIDVYLKERGRVDPHSITLTKGTEKVHFVNFIPKIEEYEFNNALLKLEKNHEKKAIIRKILEVVNENIAFYKEQLDACTFNKN